MVLGRLQVLLRPDLLTQLAPQVALLDVHPIEKLPGASALDYGESVIGVRMLTDHQSFFDHLKAEGRVPEDRWTAVQGTALRCGVSAGPERDTSKVACRTTRLHEESAQSERHVYMWIHVYMWMHIDE